MSKNTKELEKTNDKEDIEIICTVNNKEIIIPLIDANLFPDGKKITKLFYKISGIYQKKDLADTDKLFKMYEVMVDEIYQEDLSYLDIDWYKPGMPVEQIVMKNYINWVKVFTQTFPSQKEKTKIEKVKEKISQEIQKG
jgi:hypothetical protein